jgi:hypothetical protein
MTEIISSFLVHSQLIFNLCATIVLFVFLIKVTKLKLKSIPLFLLGILGFLITTHEMKLTYYTDKVELTPYDMNYLKKGENTLVIVAQGTFVSPHEDVLTKNKTMVENHGGRDIPGLGEIEKKYFNDSTHVSTYTGTHNLLLTTEDIIQEVYYFKQLNPNGKVVLLGHSLGSYNLIKACEKLKNLNIDVDLLITIDPQYKDKTRRVQETLVLNCMIPSNVKVCLNYYVRDIDEFQEELLSGGNAYPINKEKTKVVNYAVSNCTHTNIDNSLAKPLQSLIKEYLETNQDPVELSKKIKKITIIPNKPYKKISIFDLINK